MKKIIITATAAILAMAFDLGAQPRRIVCDETCRDELLKTQSAPARGENTPGVPLYGVVSPVGKSTVSPIEQAPRLSTLEGKRIALVGVSFMTGITHPEIKRLIEKNYPSAKVFLPDEVGCAGVYPAPGVRRKSVETFQQRLKDLKIDAVISGNGGCGLCTPKETGSCIAAEMLGIPSVLIAGPGFAQQARFTAACSGISIMRVAQYPGAFALDTEKTLLQNTREILWPQIVEALTKPASEEETAPLKDSAGIDPRSDVFIGTLDEVNGFFCDQQWTDGLPIIPPTFEKVSGYLQYTPCRWDETLAVLPVAKREATAWNVAVNAVMAGCPPEFMPVLIAITKGLGDARFRRTLSSTHAWIPYCWINGPIAKDLGIDCSQGQINEEANARIGRFISLALVNLCGYYVKTDRMGTFGYPMPWCLAEDEEACKRVGWEPYHVRNGFRSDESVVTLGSTLLWGNNMAPSTTDPQRLAELLAWDISERGQFALGSGKQFTFRTVLMTEPVAATLSSAYKTPEELEKTLVRLSRRPLKERAFANYYANPGGRKDGAQHNLRQFAAHLEKTEQGQLTKTPAWYDSAASEIKTVPTMKPGMTAFLITGDSARNKVQTMPGGGYASIRIELPSNWKELLSLSADAQ